MNLTVLVPCRGSAKIKIEKTKDDLKLTMSSPDGDSRWRHLTPQASFDIIATLAKCNDWSGLDLDAETIAALQKLAAKA